MLALKKLVDLALGGGALLDGLGVGGSRSDEGGPGGLEMAFLGGDGGFEGFDGGVTGQGVEVLGLVREGGLQGIHEMGEAVRERRAKGFGVGWEGGGWGWRGFGGGF